MVQKPEPTEFKPRLNLRKNIPYEHVVIPYAQLHEDLKKHVNEIRKSVIASRFGTIGLGAKLTGALLGSTHIDSAAFPAGVVAILLAPTSKEMFLKRK